MVKDKEEGSGIITRGRGRAASALAGATLPSVVAGHQTFAQALAEFQRQRGSMGSSRRARSSSRVRRSEPPSRGLAMSTPKGDSMAEERPATAHEFKINAQEREQMSTTTGMGKSSNSLLEGYHSRAENSMPNRPYTAETESDRRVLMTVQARGGTGSDPAGARSPATGRAATFAKGQSPSACKKTKNTGTLTRCSSEEDKLASGLVSTEASGAMGNKILSTGSQATTSVDTEDGVARTDCKGFDQPLKYAGPAPCELIEDKACSRNILIEGEEFQGAATQLLQICGNSPIQALLLLVDFFCKTFPDK